ncbi:MAG: DUF3784 domain-containing protein [Bacteroidota bacterium]
MEYINIGIGLFMILSGFLVKRYPNLIAGYNTMSAERKKYVNIEGLSSWMKNGFILIGVLIIISSFLLKALSLDTWSGLIMAIILSVGTIAMVILAGRFDQYKSEK